MSYHELEKIDVCLAERTIATAGPHCTPVSSIIKENTIIHGAMDNFDHEENTQSGKGGSHDTILMLFQNSNGTSQDSQQIISRISDNITPKRRSLEHILDCQKLVRRGKLLKEDASVTPFNQASVLITLQPLLLHQFTTNSGCYYNIATDTSLKVIMKTNYARLHHLQQQTAYLLLTANLS